MREFSLPALYEVPADGNLTDSSAATPRSIPTSPSSAARSGGVWQDVTATAFLAEVRAAAKGLIASGVQPGDRVALMSRTRYEWTLLDFAIWSAGRGHRAGVRDQLAGAGRSGSSATRARSPSSSSSTAHAAAVESVRERLPALKHVWRIDAGGGRRTLGAARAADVSDATRRRAQLARQGRLTRRPSSTPRGTTGRPKGCVLTHRSFFAECGNVVERLRPLFRTGECSVLLFLPLAHVFGRLVQVAADDGADQARARVPDIKNLTDELAVLPARR